MEPTLWPWLALLVLGAGHGLNPGMGWLFAVALGLQEQRAAAVWRALLPLAAGHALAVALAVTASLVAGLALPPAVLRWTVGAGLIGLGLFKLIRPRHIAYGGMRVGFRQLTVWSLLMATAHGAGLMVLPLVLGGGGVGTAAGFSPDPRGHGAHHALPLAHATMAPVADAAGFSGLLATLAHTAGYLVVTGLAAVLVYRWYGLRMLRTWWINLDLIWAVALIGTGALTVLL